MPVIRLPNNWAPRPYQRKAWGFLEGGGRFVDCCWHRRAGKDDFALHWTAIAAHQRIGTYWHMLPEASQARKAIWEAINPHSGKRRIDEAFPEELRARTLNNEMFIGLKSGSTWQVVGSDNFNSLVGSPPVGVVFSEWSLAKPDSWSYLRPILAENKGWGLFIWTPRGLNHATRSFASRSIDPQWFVEKLAATDTHVFEPEALESERQAYIAETGSEDEGNALFAQEYLVEFHAAVRGSYYGALLSKAQADGRIGTFSHDPQYPVDTAWDIGVDDYNAVWLLQNDGVKVWAIGYDETSGEGPEAIIERALPKEYKYGRHYFPHDIRNREWGAGAKSRLEIVRGLGLTNINVGIPNGPEDRIAAVRRLLPIMAFDQKGCASGVERLRGYTRKWVESMHVFAGPLHDQNSHGADALGEFAINCPVVPKQKILPDPNPPDLGLWGPREEKRSWKVA